MVDFESLPRVFADGGVRFVIVGGVATLHGSARLTSGLDVVYARDDEELERIVSPW